MRVRARVCICLRVCSMYDYVSVGVCVQLDWEIKLWVNDC